MCNKHRECFIGDTASLGRYAEVAHEAEQEEPNIEPAIQEATPEGGNNKPVKTKKVSTKKKPPLMVTSEPETEVVDGLKIDADFLRSAVEKSTESTVNTLLSTILLCAHECAKEGLRSFTYNTDDFPKELISARTKTGQPLGEVVEKLKVELKNRGLSVTGTDSTLEIGW